MEKQAKSHSACQFRADKAWLDRQHHADKSIKKPAELEDKMQNPPGEVDSDTLDRIQGSMIGMALGDALGASVEFRPHAYLVENPVKDMHGGGTWGLQKGQFTDDTSMALCLANSLIVRRDFVPYDQLVRYKWWFKEGYMSSTGKCFDIGSATKQSLNEFEGRQNGFAKKYHIPPEEMDFLSDSNLLGKFNVNCSREGVAGNGTLMRLAPVPLFFQKHPVEAVAFSGFSGVISHGDRIAFDACRYYGALIVGAVHGLSKKELVEENFYSKYQGLFNNIPIHPEIMTIAQGSYRKEGGYDKGIRGKGYIASALEAALWAFWSQDTFEKGALAAVNLGDDTDTTAAIYGQLAGAHYGYKKLPGKWVKDLYASNFIQCLSRWIVYEGERWQPGGTYLSDIPPLASQLQSNAANNSSVKKQGNENKQPTHIHTSKSQSKAQQFSETWSSDNQKNKSTSGSTQVSHNDAGGTSLYNTAAPGASGFRSGSNQHSLQHWFSMYSSLPRYSCEGLKTCEDVLNWLKKLGNEYVDYINAFNNDFVDGFWLLNYIDDRSLLEKYKIQNSKHRQVILDEIQKLKEVSTVPV